MTRKTRVWRAIGVIISVCVLAASVGLLVVNATLGPDAPVTNLLRNLTVIFVLCQIVTISVYLVYRLRDNR